MIKQHNWKIIKLFFIIALALGIYSYFWIKFASLLDFSEKSVFPKNNELGISQGYAFDFHLSVPFSIIPLFIEPLYLPKFDLEITNRGRDLEFGEPSIWYAEYPHNDPSSHSIIETPTDFAHRSLKDFKRGDKRRLDFSNSYRFSKPGDYVISLKIFIATPMDYSDMPKGIRDSIVPPPGLRKMVLIYDVRFPNVIRVYPVDTLIVLITLISAISTIIIWACSKLMKEKT